MAKAPDDRRQGGVFITFEGGEGAGKSTQINLLAERLRAAGNTVTMTREPGGAPGAERIRDLLVKGDADRWTPKAEALMHYAAREMHLTRTIRPALARGDWVLCDRFIDSTMAYQGYAQGLGTAPIVALQDLVVGPTVPDLTFLIDLSVETGLQRAAARQDDERRYEEMGTAFHEKLREAFLAIAEANPDRIRVVDGSREIDAVGDDIWRITQRQFLT